MTADVREELLQNITTKLVVFTLLVLMVLTFLMYTLSFGQEKPILVVLVFTAGLLGGFVSIQQRLPRISEEELRALTGSWVSVTLIPINGGIFSLVLMFMFIGKIIQGSLFPAYPTIEISNTAEFFAWVRDNYPLTGTEVSKLLFWSFVAGFSERFVPQVIMKASSHNGADSTKHDA